MNYKVNLNINENTPIGNIPSNKNGIWWGWEKDLQRKSAELYASRKRKNQ